MLKELHSRNGIIITTANKGSAVVVLDARDYLKIKTKPAWCKKLKTNESWSNYGQERNSQQRNLMIPRRRLNYENITELLKNENPKTPHFYLKHKLHKESILGILFCSSVNCNTSKSSESVDHHLQPIAKKIILRQKHKWLPTKTKKKRKYTNWLIPCTSQLKVILF